MADMNGGHCASCGVANVATAHFCMSCGAPLGRLCASCGATAGEDARYCIECGATLEPAAEAVAESVNATEERRIVTVLFADLVGFTSVSEQLDHESLKALVVRCLTRLSVEVERFGGYVDQYIGDNVMAVFGAPVAHEDDPERAVRAAWGMQAAMVELNRGIAPEFGVELELRVGVNTGEVSTGRIGREYTVIGDAVNVASRLQGAAPVGSILVGDRTRRLSAGVASYRHVGPLTLQGKSEPVEAWVVTGLSDVGPVSAAVESSGPFVNRHVELSQLLALFDRVSRDRAPQIVSVFGEAGVGKSRIVGEFERRLRARDAKVQIRRGHCPSFGTGMVYWPLSEMMRAECGIGPGDSAAEAREKLGGRLTALLGGGEAVELLDRRLDPLARLMGAEPLGGGEEPERRDEQSARESFFGAVRTVVEALAEQAPLILVWEDIHFADDGLLDLVEYLAQWMRAPVLQVCLARDELLERRPSWGQFRRGATSILLEPLNSQETRELVSALAVGTGAADVMTAELAQRSGGNPLFAEALVELAADAGPGHRAELPETVQGLLAARLDALEPLERQLLDHAAVVGGSFAESALEPIAGWVGADLTRSLLSLRQKNLIVPAVGTGRDELTFKHALIRDVAYEMLPLAARARKHAEIAAFIERRVGGSDDSVAPLLAEHYGRAATLAAQAHLAATDVVRLQRKALEWGESAGDGAAQLFSNQAAIDHYRAAEAFAQTGEQAVFRLAQKRGDVELRLGHAEAAIAVWKRCLDSLAAEALEQRAVIHRKIAAAFTQSGRRDAAIEHLQVGIDLIKDLPPSPELVHLFEEAALLHLQVGDNIWAVYASERALRFAEELGEPRLASRAQGVYGRVFGRVGDATKAREHLGRAVALARTSDVGEVILALLASGRNLEDCEGDYAAAEACYREALELAERVGEVPAQIELRSALGQLAFYRCDWEQVAGAAELSTALARREGLVGMLCLADVLEGQLRWREGAWEESERLFRHAHATALEGGWFEVSIRALTGLSETLRDRGELSSAEAALGQALAVCERVGFVPRIVQVQSALTLARVLGGRLDAARDSAAQAVQLGRRVRDPINEAAALEAGGLVAALPEALDELALARDLWKRLGRRLDAARCVMLLGGRISERGGHAGAEMLASAAELFDELGVGHLAEQAMERARRSPGG